MPKYIYRAKKGPTEIVKDVIEAQSKDEAVEKISRLGLLPLNIEEESAVAQKPGVSAPVSLSGGRVPSREVTIFSRQLSSLIKSGVPILRSLAIIAEQTEVAAFKAVLAKVATDVKEGQSFSRALEAWPSVFGAFYIAMVRSGEDSGTLQDTLLRIAAYRKAQEEMLARVRAAMAYPILMALVGVGTIVFMFMFVLPKLMVIFSSMGQELPVPTQIVVGISVFLKKYWIHVLAALAVVSFLISKTFSFKVRKKFMSVVALHIPVFSQFLRKNEFARFCRTLEVMIRSGIPILKALSISIPILDNEVIKTELGRCSRELEQGASFGRSLKASKVFSTFMVSLVMVGEESGKLDEALAEVADTYESECDETIKVMTSLLEPAMILVMGLVVGFIVMAMLLPIFQIDVIAR
ncbi:MAG: type II secretion system F family protein [Candidatus Omnitrophica bacterium]|nr:type II secretion system F family protein [Candidatus Omnitrophota bacterium]